MKNSKPAIISERLRPKLVAKKPDRAEPMIQPIRALAEVKPCQVSVYEKSLASMKKACRPFSAPDITAVSYPKSKPPSTATITILIK